MAIGDKYAPLTARLQGYSEDSVRFSFQELNTIIKIPSSAYKNRSSWANLTIPSSFSSSWTNAGYVVSAVSLNEQWVEFTQGSYKRSLHKPIPAIKPISPDLPATVLQCGYNCYNHIAADPNHRYRSWEHCHEAFKAHRHTHDEHNIDYLCLHLAWYLASWGMLRNSFLIQKDYKIHYNVVKLIYDPKWSVLWDISADNLSDPHCANLIMELSQRINTTYIDSNAGIPTETLLTKILLGTVGCAPAYDRYFKKALSLTKVASQSFSSKSIVQLGRFYLAHKEDFDALCQHCSKRIEYPAGKIIDMCFFEYGFQHDSSTQKATK